jgi:hypothetical protein
MGKTKICQRSAKVSGVQTGNAQKIIIVKRAVVAVYLRF